MWLKTHCQYKWLRCEIKDQLVCHCRVGCHFAEIMQDGVFNLPSHKELTKFMGTA